MRIRVLTAWLLCAMVMAQPAKPLHADRVVVLKKERPRELLSGGEGDQVKKCAWCSACKMMGL